MSEQDILQASFIEAIKEKVPQRGKLTGILVDILYIEKEAIYRRLRNEVPFTFAEVVKIAKELNISLDNIIGTSSPKSRPFQLKLTDYHNPNELDYVMHEEFLELLNTASKSEYSEMGFATSIIPLHFSTKFELIQRFYTLRWLYQFGNPGSVEPFSKIIIADRMKCHCRKFLKEIENVKYTYFIWDELLLFYVMNDIKYFNSIRLITNEEVILLKQELTEFLNHLEMLTIKGSFSNGNKIRMYVSSLNFETTYTYLQTEELHLTLIKTFTLNEIASLDEEVFNKLKTWIQALKRTSILISESDEKNRILFFEKQRSFLGTSF